MLDQQMQKDIEILRRSLSRCCQKCYYVFTQLEFLLTKGHGAFFHYRRVCLQSHVAKLHLYLCQWKKFPSGNISRNQGKDLSNLPRSKEVTAGFPSIRLPFSPTPAKKMSYFLAQRLSHQPPLCAQGKPLGGPRGCGAAHDEQVCILGHGSPSPPSLDGNKGKNKGGRISAS